MSQLWGCLERHFLAFHWWVCLDSGLLAGVPECTVMITRVGTSGLSLSVLKVGRGPQHHRQFLWSTPAGLLLA